MGCSMVILQVHLKAGDYIVPLIRDIPLISLTEPAICAGLLEKTPRVNFSNPGR